MIYGRFDSLPNKVLDRAGYRDKKCAVNESYLSF